MFSVAVLLGGGATAVRGQSALDGFDPNANGNLQVVVLQSDGKILIGGGFTTVLGVTRNNIARLNPDGTLDTAFNPNADGVVRAIAVQSDGKVLAGGDFTNIGGQARNAIARLDATSGAADTFDPNANVNVYTLAVQSDGKILAGGNFGVIGGQSRSCIARLDPTTGMADSFNPNATGGVFSIVVQPDGKILVGGLFSNIGGQPRVRIARLNATTGLADSFNPNSNDIVRAIALQADGKILVGGSFTGASSIGGQTRNRIARLDPTSGAADSFDPNADNPVYSLAVQADGQILVGGDFFNIGGQSRFLMARLDAISGAADSFDPNANNTVASIAVAPDGKIVAGGGFTSIGGATRNHIARLETNGRADRTLNLNIMARPSGGSPSGTNPFVFATVVQPDGKILIGGKFSGVLGVTRNNIARLNLDGTLDLVFDPNANNPVYSIAVQADGKILAGGLFNGTNSIGGLTRNYIARLDGTTGMADSFDPNANNEVDSIASQPDGRILVGGKFSGASSIGGQTRNRIARLDPTGMADSFDPNANDSVNSIATQPDGRIVVGGSFTSIGGPARDHIARLDATTGLADLFDPDSNNEVNSIATQPDGRIVVGGKFSGVNSIGGQMRNSIARLDPSTGLADSFDPNANLNGNPATINSIALQADGKILAVGLFTNIGGQARNYIARLGATLGSADSFDANASGELDSIATQPDGKILVGGRFSGENSIGGQPRDLFARLSNDIAALQNLAVTRTTVTWTRGGSSPQLARVTFEYSTNYVTYAPLGNGTAAGSSWTLTGLSLPTGQNIYIRARGYYSSGYLNASESITESVRNAFITGISGTISYCSNPALPPVPGVTMSLTGPSPAPSSTLTNGSGNYTLADLTPGGTYTVTPTKAAHVPGSAGINTVDVIAVQRNLLNIGTPLSGCGLTAADVNGDAAVNTVDVIAIQRFALGLATGIANTGKYQFTPASTTYTEIRGDQTAQNYNALVFGDVATPFAP